MFNIFNDFRSRWLRCRIDLVAGTTGVVVLKCTRTVAGSFLLVQGINTVFLTTTYFLLACSLREVLLPVFKGILTPINDHNVGLGLLLSLILPRFDIFVFLSLSTDDIFFFSNDIFVIVQFNRAFFSSDIFLIALPILVNSIVLIGVKCVGLERIDLLVNFLLIFLFTSIPLQHLQRLSPSPFSLCTFKVTGSHHCIHSLSRRSIFGLGLCGDSFLSHVAFSS